MKKCTNCGGKNIIIEILFASETAQRKCEDCGACQGLPIIETPGKVAEGGQVTQFEYLRMEATDKEREEKALQFANEKNWELVGVTRGYTKRLNPNFDSRCLSDENNRMLIEVETTFFYFKRETKDLTAQDIYETMFPFSGQVGE
jgi:hypothetical protein